MNDNLITDNKTQVDSPDTSAVKQNIQTSILHNALNLSNNLRILVKVLQVDLQNVNVLVLSRQVAQFL